jgi:tetratricopeptide (TPR) repeat protein
VRWRDDERSNFRTVFDWALDTGEAGLAAEIAIEFRNYLAVSNLGEEATALTNAALAALGQENSHRHVRLLEFAVQNTMYFGDREQAQELAEALHVEAKMLGDNRAMGSALHTQAMHAMRNGDFASALELNAEAIDNLRGELEVVDHLTQQSFYYTVTGQSEKALETLDRISAETSHLASQGEHRWIQATRNRYRAFALAYAGEIDRARELLQAETNYARQFGPDVLSWSKWHVALARNDPQAALEAAIELRMATPESAHLDRRRDVANLHALPLLEIDGPELAKPYLREAFETLGEHPYVIDAADIAITIGDLALAERECERATRLYAALSAIYEWSGFTLARWQQDRLESNLAILHDALDGHRFDRLWAEGSAMTPNEMVRHAAEYLGLELHSPT